MLPLTSDDSGASQLIGYVYTALISVLILLFVFFYVLMTAEKKDDDEDSGSW